MLSTNRTGSAAYITRGSTRQSAHRDIGFPMSQVNFEKVDGASIGLRDRNKPGRQDFIGVASDRMGDIVDGAHTYGHRDFVEHGDENKSGLNTSGSKNFIATFACARSTLFNDCLTR